MCISTPPDATGKIFFCNLKSYAGFIYLKLTKNYYKNKYQVKTNYNGEEQVELN